MSGFYSYSPWRDAANFGQGVGSALSQALIQRPEINAQAALMRQQLSKQQQEEPLDLDLKRAQIRNLDYRPDYLGQVLQAKIDAQTDRQNNAEQIFGLKKDIADRDTKYGEALAELRKAQAGAIEKKSEEGSPWGNLAGKLSLLKGREQELAGSDSSIQGKLPISPNMDLKNLVMQAKTPEDVQSILALAKLSPNLETNKVSHWFGGDTDNVTTNSYTMGIGDDDLAAFGVTHTGKVPNASLPKPGGEGNTNAQPEAPKGMIRVKSPEGKNRYDTSRSS